MSPYTKNKCYIHIQRCAFHVFSSNNRCFSTVDVDDFVKKTKQSLQQYQRSTLIIVHSLNLNSDLYVFQDSKKFFKRADLVRKEQEEYFKKCGIKVRTRCRQLVVVLFILSCSNTVSHLSRNRDPMMLRFIRMFCVYCAVFPNLPLLPASVGSERDFWEPGMGCTVKNPCLDAWQKDKSLCPKTFYFLDALPEIPIQQQ